MTTTTPFQAVTANFITSYVGRTDFSAIHIEGALVDGSTFDQTITLKAAQELLTDLGEAIEGEEEHRNVGAAFAMDPGSAA